MMNTMIPVENGDVLTGVQIFLQRLMQSDVVEAIYVPMRVDGGAIMPALVTNPSLLKQADPLSPVMPINGARAVSALTNKHAPARLGAVLRPCELRALVELVKLQQATLDGLTLISLDCPGTCELSDYQAHSRENGFDLKNYLEVASSGSVSEGLELRPACQMCTQPVYDDADVHLDIFGADLGRGIPITVRDEIAEQLEERLESQPAGNHKQVVEQIINRRGQIRQAELDGIRKRIASNGGIAELFATCQRCHNCMTVCPICYCKTCLFRSEAMNHPPEYYLTAAHRKGAVRLLSDTLLFHMTRLNHMGLSCVSCGMCTSACPADIPVGAIFSAIGEQVQGTFDYHPGRDVGEPLPLITFQPNEWTEVGEQR
jgi:formate dehydrogenase subunit beta